MRRFCSFFVLTAAIGVTGCGQFSGSFSSSPRGGIAVVDLDKVAAETGRDRQLSQSLEMAQNSLNQSFAKTVESAKSQLNAKVKEFGENISDSEKKELSDMERNATSRLTEIKKKAQIEFETYKQKQIAQFRAELKPIAQEIAAKRGLGIVIPKNDGLLLSVDPGVDITDDVVKALRDRHPVSGLTSTSEAPAGNAQKTAPPRKNGSPVKSAAAPRGAAPAEDDEAFR